MKKRAQLSRGTPSLILRLLVNSKEDVKEKYGKDIMDYATKHNTNLDKMLDEEALRNLYSYKYIFNI